MDMSRYHVAVGEYRTGFSKDDQRLCTVFVKTQNLLQVCSQPEK